MRRPVPGRPWPGSPSQRPGPSPRDPTEPLGFADSCSLLSLELLFPPQPGHDTQVHREPRSERAPSSGDRGPAPLPPSNPAVSMFAMSWAPRPMSIHPDARRPTVVKVSPLTIPLSRYPRPPATSPRTPESIAIGACILRSSHHRRSELGNLPCRLPSRRGL